MSEVAFRKSQEEPYRQLRIEINKLGVSTQRHIKGFFQNNNIPLSAARREWTTTDGSTGCFLDLWISEEGFEGFQTNV